MAPRLAVLAVAAFFSLATSSPAPPSSESCEDSVRTDVTAVEIGHGDPFVPLTDGEIVDIVVGAQGGDMIPVRLRASGGAGCMEQETVLLAPHGGQIAFEGVPLRFRDQGDGTFLTSDVWLILEWGGDEGVLATVSTTVGGATDTVDIWIAEPYAGPAISWPAEPIVLGVAAETPVVIEASEVAPEGAPFFIAIADESIAVHTNGGFGSIDWGLDTGTTYLRGQSPGTTEATLFFGDQQVTTTITVE